MSSRTASRNVSRTESRHQDVASRMSRRDRHRESRNDKRTDNNKSRSEEKLDKKEEKLHNNEEDKKEENNHGKDSPKTGLNRDKSGDESGRNSQKHKERNSDSRISKHEEDKTKRPDTRNRDSSVDSQVEVDNDEKSTDVRLIKLADNAERYDHMSEYMMTFAKQRKYLNNEERDLLWVSFRNRVKPYRKSWRVVTKFEEDSKFDEKEFKTMIAKFKRSIKKDVEDFCENFLSLLDETLIPNTRGNGTSKEDGQEAEIFYHKLKGDSYRYLWELFVNDKDQEKIRQKFGELAKEAYTTAHKDAEKLLRNAHPLRLGLALNYSVLLYEVVGEQEKAKEVAKDAVDKADKDLSRREGKGDEDASSVMAMIEENLKLWKEQSK